MKLWLKIYLFSLILFVLSLNLVGFLMIQNFHTNLLKKEIQNCVNEENFLAYEFKLQNVDTSNSNFEHSLSKLMNNFSSSFKYEGSFQILDSKNTLFYSDFDFPICKEQPELESLSVGQTHYIIRPYNNHYYLYLCSTADTYNTFLKLYYAKDVSSIYTQRQSQFIFFIRISILISVIFAIFMFFISRIITKPILTLTASTQKIASGHYHERVMTSSCDEFKLLSDNFNLMAETIEDKIAQLELSNEEKEAFINNFTHELKTPLTSIIGYATFIRNSKYNEQLFFEASDYIYKESKNLEQIAFKMMDLIYAKSNNLFFQLENIPLLFEETKKSLLPKLSAKQVDLILSSPDLTLMADKTLIKMLLCNLIENALKASPSGSRILLTATQSDNQIILSVQDFGIGIAPEHLDKIFEPFYIVDAARTKKNNGAGIGLSICQKVAQVHHAKIHIDSQLNKGTIVSIIFTPTEHLTTI